MLGNTTDSLWLFSTSTLHSVARHVPQSDFRRNLATLSSQLDNPLYLQIVRRAPLVKSCGMWPNPVLLVDLAAYMPGSPL